MFEECEKITTSPAATQLLELTQKMMKAQEDLDLYIGSGYGIANKVFAGDMKTAQIYLNNASLSAANIRNLISQIDQIPITHDLLCELLFVTETGEFPLGQEQIVKIKVLQGWKYEVICEAVAILLSREEVSKVFKAGDACTGFLVFENGLVAASVQNSTSDLKFAAPWLDALVGNEFNLDSFKHQGLRYVEFQKEVQALRPFLEKARL